MAAVGASWSRVGQVLDDGAVDGEFVGMGAGRGRRGFGDEGLEDLVLWGLSEWESMCG